MLRFISIKICTIWDTFSLLVSLIVYLEGYAVFAGIIIKFLKFEDSSMSILNQSNSLKGKVLSFITKYQLYISNEVFFNEIKYKKIYATIITANIKSTDIHHIIHHLKKEKKIKKQATEKKIIYHKGHLLIISHSYIFKESIIFIHHQIKLA